MLGEMWDASWSKLQMKIIQILAIYSAAEEGEKGKIPF